MGTYFTIKLFQQIEIKFGDNGVELILQTRVLYTDFSLNTGFSYENEKRQVGMRTGMLFWKLKTGS
jgi:hypothetical protein